MGTLIIKMRELATSKTLKKSDQDLLRQRADELEAALHAGEEEYCMKRMLGCWARARKLYCEISGEPLF